MIEDIINRACLRRDSRCLITFSFWTGRAALNNGLVDSIGGIIDAVNIASQLANIDDYVLIELPRKKTGFDAIIDNIEAQSKISKIGAEKFYLNELKNKYLVFSGIGNHKTFVEMVKKYSFNVLKDIEFPDHYNYTDVDLNKIVDEAKKLNCKIITTEKDYFRLEDKNLSEIKFIKSEFMKIIKSESIVNVIMTIYIGTLYSYKDIIIYYFSRVDFKGIYFTIRQRVTNILDIIFKDTYYF